jgi:hypothetical protein
MYVCIEVLSRSVLDKLVAQLINVDVDKVEARVAATLKIMNVPKVSYIEKQGKEGSNLYLA